MTAKTLFPALVKKLQSKIKKNLNTTCNINSSIDDLDEGISLADQCTYGESALRMIGLTERFAKLVVFCGHGSTTENNAYATALNCGACGGHDGAANAKLLAKILNNQHVRDNLEASGITIPSDTQFVAALHDTTTDTIEIVDQNPHETDDHLQKLTAALEKAKRRNTQSRIKHLSPSISHDSVQQLSERSTDWAETRPEWGLARNAAFIIGPRTETSSINLDGRAFLHSYDWKKDRDGRSLTTILTAPMVVAQWINCQYLFSTLDNVTYGSGSKITHNVVGKIGIMQGNASDLMNGLPLQSVNINDHESYHEPMRLLTVVYSPKSMLNKIISTEDILQQLFGNGWVLLVCIDPTDGLSYELQRNLTWKTIDTSYQKTRRIH